MFDQVPIPRAKSVTKKRKPLEHVKPRRLTYEGTRDVLFAFVDKHQRIPTWRERSETGVPYLQWLIDQKKKINKGDYEIYLDLARNPIIKKYLDFDASADVYKTNRNLVLMFVKKNKRLPSTYDKIDKLNYRSWLVTQKQLIRNSNRQDVYNDLAVNPILKKYLDE